MILKPIPTHKDYFASDDGEIWSVKPNNYSHREKPKEPIKLKKFLRGRKPKLYWCVTISVNKKPKIIGVASLVLEAFVSPRPVGMLACHGAGGRLVNTPDNLYWATPEQNMADRWRDGTVRIGENHHASRFTREDIFKIRELFAKRVSDLTIARMYGVSRMAIWQIKKGRSWGWL